MFLISKTLDQLHSGTELEKLVYKLVINHHNNYLYLESPAPNIYTLKSCFDKDKPDSSKYTFGMAREAF